MEHNKQTKTRFALQETRIAKLFKLKGALYLITIAFVWIFAPFIHVLYLDSDAKGLFGFKWMMSFLFALALPFSLLCGAFYVKFLAGFAPEPIKKFSYRLTDIIIASGIFFLLWSFYPMTDDFSWYIYYPLLITLSVAFGLFSYRIHKYFLNNEEQLKNKIYKLTKAIQILIRFATQQRFKAKDIREYEVDYREVLTQVDNTTD